jgi:hypothetical protein
MSKRSSKRPLYEYMTAGRMRGLPPAMRRTGRSPEECGGTGGLLTSRAVRVPIGFVFIAAAGVIVLIILAYLLGAQRGRDAAEAEFDDRLLAGGAAGVSDPLVEGAPGGGAPSEFPLSGTNELRAPASPPDSADWGPLESDPRSPGLYYFIIAETIPSGAHRLASFCRDHGLEAYVIESNNASRRRVIVLPGLPTNVRTHPDVRRLENEILRVGELWEAEARGHQDFHGAYMSIYEG